MTSSRALVAVASALRDLLGLVLPVDCAGCGSADQGLCGSCRQLLAGPARPVDAAGLPPTLPAWAGPDYAGPVARVVVAWKDQGRHDVDRFVADALAAAVLAAVRALDGERTTGGSTTGGRHPLLVVPVPSSRAGRRRRGRDAVRGLAERAVARLENGGLEAGELVVRPLLRVARAVEDQSGLGASARARNVTGAFAVRSRARGAARGRPVLVVDDVLTTGATLAEAVRVLRDDGAHVVGVAAATATPLRFPRRVTGSAHLV